MIKLFESVLREMDESMPRNQTGIDGYVRDLKQMISSIANQRTINGGKAVDMILTAFLHGGNAARQGLSNKECRDLLDEIRHSKM